MRRIIPPLCLLLAASNLLAQTVPQVDVKAMLDGLQQLKDKQAKSAHAQLTNTLTAFSNAASTDEAALDFYLEAIRVTQFVGRPQEQTAFQNWKKRELAKLRPAAIRTCLRYTTISLQRAAGATDQQIFPAVLAYAQDTLTLLPSIYDQDIIKAPITGNVFSKWYNLSDELSGLENWEMSPGNVDSIYEKFLMPIMRKNHDPRILQYWDNKIATETAQASGSGNAFGVDRFNQTRRPELLWSRSEDVIAIGARDQGLSTMYTIIKTFPDHPSAGKWIDELQALLTAPAASGTAAPTTAQ